MNSVQSLFAMGGFLVLIGSIPLSVMAENFYILGAGAVLALVIWIFTAIVFSCLSQIYRAALYIYATTNEPPRTFRKELLEGAFSN